ncbi:transcription termination factor 4, mitochondrial-like [Medicago truncatula]|uniref:transcription termination factor 4, mitochondrial-like n=1 Tax=Medicago truncatula TaxID=3880 RepID=UPI00196819FE|nr:transcription termination factor 4, mitochondrial-like [Medicago truncatula]
MDRREKLGVIAEAAYRTEATEFLEENLEIPSYPEIVFPIKLQLWAKASEKGKPDGGKGRKGRMYGLGPLADNVVHVDLFYVPPPPESSSRSRELPLEMQAMIQRMNQELQSQKETLAKKEESANELRELMAKQAEEMRKLKRMVTKRMGGMKSRKTLESSSPLSQSSPSVQEDRTHDDDNDDDDKDEDEDEDEDEEEERDDDHNE